MATITRVRFNSQFRIMLPTMLFALGSGCLLPHREPPLAIVVRDAETGKPIPGAAVQISDPLAPPSRSLAEPHGTTGPDGVVQIKRKQKQEDTRELVETTAPGYFMAVQDLESAVKKQNPGAPSGTATSIAVEMFAEPRPVIELVVPAGFRGLVKAEVVVRDPQPGDKPGQRQFTFRVSPDGAVEVNGSPVLRYAVAMDYKARYESGEPLKTDAAVSEIGLRWVRTGGHTEYFVVGSKQEWDEVRRSMEHEPTRGRSTDGSGGGRGGGGRRGGGGGGRGGR